LALTKLWFVGFQTTEVQIFKSYKPKNRSEQGADMATDTKAISRNKNR